MRSPAQNTGVSVLVVGAGISGVACAQRLTRAGITVQVADLGRVLGGRMASRRWDGRVVDLGASYLTASDPPFTAVVEGLVDRGVLRPWTDTFAVVSDGVWSSKSGPLRYAAPGGIRSVVEALAKGLDLRPESPVGAVGPGPIADGVSYDAVVLAMPAPQALRLLGRSLTAERGALEAQSYEAVMALAARYEAVPDRLGDGVFVNGVEVLSFVAHDGRRRGDDAPVLVAHSPDAYARRFLTDRQAALPEMVDALDAVLGLGRPLDTYVHRWTFAKPAQAGNRPWFLGDAMVGLCGDAWGSPKVETAWSSGDLLAVALLPRLERRK